ncbi:GNAT family N-acetyltransferase [Streptomyces bambusae]|uniref:GNAT family N-acetyltransferase n=1 Tax=Streptomyces bambusae TaxID=1550616 RepID=UPI001CFFEC76|nr:GNAT family N-acetyltransferase [Streptomyces bambusae]MCB5169780.1 GNAT family N-acetyltransferase [Streptomyces bambusae]
MTLPKITTLDAPPSAADVDAWLAVLAGAHAHDLPGVPGPGRTETAGRLGTPPVRGRAVCFAGLAGGEAGRDAAAGVAAEAAPAGGTGGAGAAAGAGFDGIAALLLYNDPGNAHAAFVDVLAVHPRARRRGLGTALWEQVRAELAAAGRTTVSTVVDLGGPGEAFARSLGFENVLPMAWYVQDTSGPVAAAGLPEGYRFVEWPGIVPDEHADAAAAAHRAMEDAPGGDLDEQPPLWDAERLRAAQRLVLARGGRMLTTAAVTPAGEVAAYTELVLPDPAGERALQYDTVVVPRHRGRGLGRAVKLRMLAGLRDQYPHVRQIATTVADENTPMRTVNEQLGYRRERACGYFQLGL